jgi:branched-chain amino acid transport system substrate-binding protein
MVKHSISTRAAVGLGLALTAAPVSARAADAYLPIVVLVTGFMSVAGGSQRNGAVMAAQNAPSGLKVEAPVFDTGTSASGAATALDKALSDKPALAASASVFGTETVAMVPVSADYKVPAAHHLGAVQAHREWQ